MSPQARRPSWIVPGIIIAGVLLMIGVGLTVGNLVGGRLADRNLLSTVIGAFICVAIVLATLSLVVHMAIPTLVRKLPEPIRKIIGDMSNTERVLVGLDLRPRQVP